MSAKDAAMSAKDAVMSAKDAAMSAKDARYNSPQPYCLHIPPPPHFISVKSTIVLR